MLAKALQQASGGVEKLYVNDVFSTYLYDGNGSTQTITNGIDLAGNGGMVWTKARSATGDNSIYDTVRGATKQLVTSQTVGEGTFATSLTAFNSTGFTLGNSTISNTSGSIYTSWTFRNAPKFFTHTTISHTNGVDTNISLTSLGEVGMVVAKITNTTGDWITWHRSLTAGNNLRLNTTAAQTTTNAWLSVSGTTATLSGSAPTGTYVIYAWAHDTSAEGVVQCGSFSGASGSVNLGWEPQFIITKGRTGSITGWRIHTAMTSSNVDLYGLEANTTAAETGYPRPEFTSKGFNFANWNTGDVVIYLAIRIPNKPPTSGTEVFQPVVYTGTNTDNRLVNTGIKTDMAWFRQRDSSSAGADGFVVGDRLRGQRWFKTGSSQVEITTADGLDQQIVSSTEYGTAFSSMTGVWVGNNTGTAASNVNINASTTANNHIVEAFRRAPGFFDIVCYTGTGAARTVPHQLGVAPEMMIVKSRNGSASPWVYYGSPTNYLFLDEVLAEASSATAWNNAAPTGSVFTVGTAINVNGTSVTYVAYLFASLPGISRVDTYTGNGTSQTIDCGFSTGARFVLIKRTDNTGNWFLFDTARGINGGGTTDPYLSANLTAAEVTTSEILSPASSGFEITTGGSSFNANGATYIYLAIA